MDFLSPAAAAAILAEAQVDNNHPNPYLAAFNHLNPGALLMNLSDPWQHWQALARISEMRAALVQHFACAIPDDAATQAIARHVPDGCIVDMCSGGGYWPWLLKKRYPAWDIVALDKSPFGDAESFCHRRWFDVQRGDEAALDRYADRALMLVWPPPRSAVALNMLERYRGSTLIYVGHALGDWTGNEEFHRLRMSWPLVERVEIPYWPGGKPFPQDYLFVHKRP